MRVSILISAALFLTACATPEERAQQMIEAHGPECRALGFTPGTDGFANCVLQMENQKHNRYQTWKAITQ